MRYFVELCYDGAAYCGWQRQRDAATAQQTLETALSTLLRRDTETVGAGRTDTGVNASYYVAHFDAADGIDCAHLTAKLNRILPPDIAISAVTPVAAEAHARFDAVEREYTYYITRRKDPFRRFSSWHYGADLDVGAMNRGRVATGRRSAHLHHPRRPLPAQYGACHRRHAGRRRPRAIYGRAVRGYSPQPRPLTCECGCSGTGSLPERRALSCQCVHTGKM